jgi:hydrogenase maturation protease
MKRTLIGGVGYRWQRDASFGVVAIDALAALDWPSEVTVADLGYGAIYAVQDIADAQPPYDRLILIAAAARDRPSGVVHRYAYESRHAEDDEVLARVREAGAGVIDLDHLLVIGEHMRALPSDVTVFEIEPANVEPGIELSDEGVRLLENVICLVREDIFSGVAQSLQPSDRGSAEAVALPQEDKCPL